MSRRQAQQALASAAALFNLDLQQMARTTTGRGQRKLAAEDAEVEQAAVDRTAVGTSTVIVPLPPPPPGEPDSRRTAKIRAKVNELFAVGESIAAASRAKQLQVTVGLPLTATIALIWDLPSRE